MKHLVYHDIINYLQYQWKFIETTLFLLMHKYFLWFFFSKYCELTTVCACEYVTADCKQLFDIKVKTFFLAISDFSNKLLFNLYKFDIKRNNDKQHLNLGQHKLYLTPTNYPKIESLHTM